MASICPRCEQLPDSPPAHGVLYLVPPINESMEALETYLSGSGLSFSRIPPGLFAIRYGQNELERLFQEYYGSVGQLEMRDTKTMILAQGREPGITDFIGMQPLSSLVARVQGTWLIDLLRENRIVAFFQPIVHAQDPSRVFGHECLSRGVDESGGYIPPNRLFDVARKADLLFNLDRACRLAIIRDAHTQGLDSTLFINFNPTSIYKPEYCLQTTLKAIRQANVAPERVVFEVVESEQVDSGHLTGILDFYRSQGFKVALDDMGAGYSSLNLLSRLKPDFIKLDIELIRGVDRDGYKAKITRNLLALARELDVPSVAEGVETVGEWEWARDNGADFVQGYLFARPAPLPPRPQLP